MTAPPGRSIAVVPHSDAWKHNFASLRDRITFVLDGVVACTIEHVGSTSVPGLSAKPIIDISIVLDRADDLPRVIDRLRSIGYAHLGDLGIPGREAFRHPSDDPPHNLYAGHRDAAAIRNHLALRDALRSDAVLVERYSALKRRLAHEHAGDIDAYTTAKTAFIAGTLERTGSFTNEELGDIRRANTR